MLVAILLAATSAQAADWPTFGHDPQRSGWAAEERTLTPANAGQLELQWKATVKNDSYSLSALTPPVVASNVSTIKGVKNVVYVSGIGGTVFALEAESGEAMWNRNLPTRTTRQTRWIPGNVPLSQRHHGDAGDRSPYRNAL